MSRRDQTADNYRRQRSLNFNQQLGNAERADLVSRANRANVVARTRNRALLENAVSSDASIPRWSARRPAKRLVIREALSRTTLIERRPRKGKQLLVIRRVRTVIKRRALLLSAAELI